MGDWSLAFHKLRARFFSAYCTAALSLRYIFIHLRSQLQITRLPTNEPYDRLLIGGPAALHRRTPSLQWHLRRQGDPRELARPILSPNILLHLQEHLGALKEAPDLLTSPRQKSLRQAPPSPQNHLTILTIPYSEGDANAARTTIAIEIHLQIA